MQILQHVQMIKDILQVEPGTIVIPFSAESKQGREEIWQIVESVIELPQGTSRRKMPKERQNKSSRHRRNRRKKETLEKDRPPGSQKDTSKRTEKEVKKK